MSSPTFSQRPALPPALGLLIGVLAVSAASLFIRYAQAEAPSLVIAAWRLTLASLVLWPILVWRHSAEVRALTRREWALAGVSGVFLGAHFGTWITSLEYTSVANSVVLVTTAPLFVAVLGALFLREALSGLVWLGLAVALAGGVVVGLSDVCTLAAGCPPLETFVRGEQFLGNALAVAGAATVAVYVLIGRRLRAGISLLVYIGLTYGAAALTMLVSVALAGLPLLGYSAETYLWLVLLALVPQLIGHSAFNWALRYLPATFVSVATLGEPIGSTVLALIFLGEVPTPLKLVGAALILGGIALTAWRRS